MVCKGHATNGSTKVPSRPVRSGGWFRLSWTQFPTRPATCPARGGRRAGGTTKPAIPEPGAC